jgi:excisionase family DNA binding protein
MVSRPHSTTHDDGERLRTRAEAARMLGLSLRSIDREIERRALGAYRLGPSGTLVRISDQQIAAYRARRERLALEAETTPDGHVAIRTLGLPRRAPARGPSRRRGTSRTR